MRFLILSELLSGHCKDSDIEIFEYFKNLCPKSIQSPDKASLQSYWQTSRITLPIFSSGTTGKPKKINVHVSDIARSINETNKETHWLTCFDHNKMAGIQVVVRSLLNHPNSSINFVSDFSLYKSIDLERITNLSLTPTFAKMNLQLLRKIGQGHITLGGEVLSKHCFELIQRTGNFSLTNIYATSELGVVCRSNSYVFKLDVTIEVKDNFLFVLRNGLSIPTGDLVEMIDSNNFVIKGRSDFAVNIGGRLTTRDELQSIYESCPLIKLAKVSFKPNSVLGHVIQLEIMLNGQDNSLSDFKYWLKNSVPKSLWPMKTIQLKESYKLSSNGKL
jgi:acyl-coenzyme A synthetase/AMP-(fatty) acid ligase